MEGTGSILLNESIKDQDKNSETININYDDVRFLSAKEVANLHCFPNDFGETFSLKLNFTLPIVYRNSYF